MIKNSFSINPFCKILFFLCILAMVDCDQLQEEPALAWVADIPVTLAEYRERLNNMLLHTTQDNAELHEAMLQNLINEKVLILEAKKRKYDLAADYQWEKERLLKDAILNFYREQLTAQRIQVTEEAIQRTFALAHEQVRARILFARSEEKARRFYQQLKNGAGFKNLAKTAFQDPRLAQTGGDLGYFSWEDIELPLAETAQHLKIGQISQPVLTPKGWYIIQVEDRFRPPFSESDYHKEYKKWKWVTTHRQQVDAIRKYTSEKAESLNITFNETLLAELMREVPGKAASNTETFADFGIDEKKIIATVADSAWTLGKFYELAKWTSTRQRNNVTDVKHLKRFIEGLAVREQLLLEAEAENIRERPQVNGVVKKQLDLFLIQKMNQQITDSVQVPEKSARAYFEQFQGQFVFPRMVNVREILVESEASAGEILKRIQSGEDFGKLAKKLSLRKWAAKRNGVLGFGTKSQLGIHGEKIFSLNINEIAGPLKTHNFYSLIQVIAFQPAKPKIYEQARVEIQQLLLSERKQQALQRTIEKMRQDVVVVFDSTR